MIFFKNFKIKLIIAIIIGVLSSLYQLEDTQELLIVQKNVTLNKNRQEAFDLLSDLTQLSTVTLIIKFKFNKKNNF